jgi:hypothetical protein
MSFDDYFKTVSKMNKSDSCPDECEFKRLSDIPAVWVHPPQNNPFIGIIISRDPTTAFIPYYNDAKSKDLSLWREDLFNSNAIPDWIYGRIEYFNRKYMENSLSNDELLNFKKILFNSVYWTHLHKCCTDKPGEASLKFSGKNAGYCADRWLKKEIESAANENIRFIITLGKDVENWFLKNGNIIPEDKNIHLYHLPHPSGAAMGAWSPKDEFVKISLGEKIKNIVLDCQNFQ